MIGFALMSFVMLLWSFTYGCSAVPMTPTTSLAGTPGHSETLGLSPTSLTNTSLIPEFPEVANLEDTPGDVAAGIYRTPANFSIPFVFQTRQPYGGLGLDERMGELFVRVPSHDSGVVFFAVDPDISLDEAIMLLRDTGDFVIGPELPVEVAGLSGMQMDFTGGGRVPAISTFIGRPAQSITDHWLIQPDQHVRYLVWMLQGAS